MKRRCRLRPFPGRKGAAKLKDTTLEELVVRPQIDLWKICLRLGFLSSTCFVLALLGSYVSQVGGIWEHGALPLCRLTALVLSTLVSVVLILNTERVFIFAILLYQRYADAETRLRCRQTPTCSNYAILAIRKYGPLRGGWMAIGRLRRCRPPGRVDYP